MNVQDKFANALRARRKELKLSQEELGDLCGIHRTEISLLERSGRDPRLTTIVKISRALEIEPSRLIEGIDLPPKG
ncbi:MAG: helix-turn-helix transcriptional regulator [Solirubrobacterales bacterium]|nr:helix-turn-helix transcriptional regulator [Solirubrobacterales bacterium]